MNELRRQPLRPQPVHGNGGRIEGMRDAFELFARSNGMSSPKAEGMDDRRLRQLTIGDGPSSTPTTQEGVVDIDLRSCSR
jgi:hypothetical protein